MTSRTHSAEAQAVGSPSHTGHGGPADRSSHHGSLLSYSIGFILSLLLTVEAYLVVVNNSFASEAAISIILGLAVVQLFVQLFFFLHLDKATRAPWNIILLGFMAVVVAIVVFGSLWIMRNLDYHMTPAETDRYIQSEERITR